MAYVGISVSLVSLFIAIFQSAKLANFRKYRVKCLRVALQNTRIVMLESDRLLNDRIRYGIEDKRAIMKLEAIHANSCGTMRSLFQELSEADTPYNETKLKIYISLGLISSKWIWQQAAMFMTGPLQNYPMPDLPDDSPDFMARACQQVVLSIQKKAT